MRLSYQYKLLPTAEQRVTLNEWLDKLRCQYNWLLAERFNWWEQNRCYVNACPIDVTHLPELKDQPNYYSQKKSLVPLKVARPWYKAVHSQVLQDMVKRVNLAFSRFISGDCNGKRSGKPRFKGVGRYHSFAYTQADIDWIDGNKIDLPKIGGVKVIWHRKFPEGFDVKTCIVSRKADGWYITLSLECKAIPDFVQPLPTPDNSVGIDVGLEKFASDSDGNFVEIPQHFRKSEPKLAKVQQKIATARKGSVAKKKLMGRAARLHQKIARQRKQFHFETANQVLDKADVVFVEGLNVKNMSRKAKPKQDETGKFLPNGQASKSGLNKSIADAGWSQFINILTFKAEKAGKKVVKVNPYGTSQHCSNCFNRVPKELSERWHSCANCGLEMDRDTNAAILIKKVGLGIASLKKARKSKGSREAYSVCKASV
jgi:putative transposase